MSCLLLSNFLAIAICLSNEFFNIQIFNKWKQIFFCTLMCYMFDSVLPFPVYKSLFGYVNSPSPCRLYLWQLNIIDTRIERNWVLKLHIFRFEEEYLNIANWNIILVSIS